MRDPSREVDGLDYRTECHNLRCSQPLFLGPFAPSYPGVRLLYDTDGVKGRVERRRAPTVPNLGYWGHCDWRGGSAARSEVGAVTSDAPRAAEPEIVVLTAVLDAKEGEE